MAAHQRLRSVEFAALSEAMAGPLWVSHMARVLGMPSRTLQRVRDSAKAGLEHRQAQRCLDLLSVALDAMAARGRGLKSRGGRREVEKRYARKAIGRRDPGD